MENNNYFYHVANEAMEYFFFKKEFKVHLAGYFVHSYSYENNDVFARAIAMYPFQNNALHIIGGMVNVTFNEPDGSGLLVFEDYQFDLMAFKEFLEKDYIETRTVNPIENITTVMDNLSEEK